MASVANAELTLRVNGLDVSKPLEITGKENIIIAIAGASNIEAENILVTAGIGKLEPLTKANTPAKRATSDQYLFNFTDESGLGVINLNIEGELVYQIVLFCVQEENETIVFGIDIDRDALTQQQEGGTQESTMSEELLSPSETPTLAVMESPVAEENTSYNFVPVTPYAEQKQQEKLKSLKYCPPAEFPDAKAEPLLTKENMGSGRVLSESYGNGMLLDGDIVTVDSDITSNTIWTADNTYHVVANINVQALLVVEPGTVVEFAYYTGMFINNGGTLISCGTPDNPIVYTSDSEYPWYGDYYCPIYIEETASASTKVTYSCIAFAYAGIIVRNKQLDTNIENNYFAYNDYSIVEWGTEHTAICNNLIFDSYDSAIYADLKSVDGQADANSHILIQNNTCDCGWCNGITVCGVPDSNNAGSVVLVNNLVSEYYYGYGLNLIDGYMYASVLNTGYYDNTYNKNWEFEEENPVIEAEWPYRDGTGWMPICYLDQNCGFINAGYEYIEETHLIGMTTDVNGTPDSNKTDIGFHYPNWDFSNVGFLSADLDGNLTVDFKDFALLANGWQTTYQMTDLAVMADEWLDRFVLGAMLDQEPNSVSGVISITLVCPSDDIAYSLFIDGQYLTAFLGGDIAIPTYEYRNGNHELKVVGVTLDDEVLVGKPIQFTAYNRLHNLTGSESYKYAQRYSISGFYEPNDGSTISFELKDLDENVIWQNSSAGSFDITVPAGVLQSPYNELTIREIEGESMGGGLSLETTGSDWPASWIKEIVKEFDVTSDPNCANARSLLVGVKKGFLGIGDWTYNRREVWKEYLNACKKGNFAPTICLFFGQATQANIKTAFGLSGVKSIMIITDGNRNVGKTYRTFFMAWDGPYFSYLRRNWEGDPNKYEPLPDEYEKGYSVADQIDSFHQRDRMYVFIDACKNGTSCMPSSWFETLGIPEPNDNNYSSGEYWKTSDMARVFDIYPDILETRLYMGWRGEAFKGNPLTHYNNFLKIIWEDVGSSNPNKNRFDFAISDAATRDWGNRIPAGNFSLVGNSAIYFGE